MTPYIQVCRTDEIPDPGKAVFEVANRLVVVFHLRGEWFCLDDVCTHDGGPLGEGTLDGYGIACPRHGAKFDVRTGMPCGMPATEATSAFEVRIENGLVLVSTEPKAMQNLPTSSPDRSEAPSDTVTADRVASNPTSKTIAPVGAPTDPVTSSTPSAQPIGPVAEDTIRERLKEVIDPELFINIIDLGLIYEVHRQGRPDGKTNVGIEMTMTSPACPAGPQLVAQSKAVVASLEGVGDVEVKVVMDPPWTPDRMTDDARDRLGIF